MKSNNYSIITFAEEVKKYIFNSNEKFIKWGADNDFPKKLIELYDSVPEHESAINFLNINTVGEGLETPDILNFWELEKLTLDYFIFGGFALKVKKLRNNNFKYEYVDISKCRLNPDKTKIGYSEDWLKYKVETEWYDIIKSVNEVKGEGIYYFKNNKSREVYPRPHYLSSLRSVQTAEAIGKYHFNNSKNGFTPNTIINFNNGEPDEETKAGIEKAIKEKFTGPDAIRFMLMFNASKDAETTIQKLDNDNLDQKFADLQKWIQNQIIISHQITSGQLIGVRPENQGFSKTEYNEAMEIFTSVIINNYRNEIEYSLSTLIGKEIKIKVEDKDDSVDSNTNNTNETEPNNE